MFSFKMALELFFFSFFPFFYLGKKLTSRTVVRTAEFGVIWE